MWHDITVSNSLGSSSSSPTDSMNVVVETGHWHIVVDHNHNVFHIKTSRSDIGSNKYVGSLADGLLELGVDLISLPLLLVSVDGLGLVRDSMLKFLIPFECLLKVITSSFSLAENNNL